ncbi:MAG: polysaccharide biosynthesis/export family protein, partial [Phycisphaerae bacterium]
EPIYDEYRVVPGDSLAVAIPDLLGLGTPYAASLEINPLGEIRIPQLGKVRVTGMTEAQIEDELRQKLVDAQILPDPTIQVQLQNRRNRIYSIIGAVAAAGPYPITRPDLRLLDAIAFARDIGPDIKKLYIIRRIGDSRPSGGMTRGQDKTFDDEKWSFDDDTFARDSENATFSTNYGTDEPGPKRRNRLVDDEFDAFLNEDFDSPRPQSSGGFQFETTDELGEQRRTTKQNLVDSFENTTSEPFDWNDVPELENTQRVIEIDVKSLKNGDPRYNVVIRDQDVIQVPVDSGVFYLMGEINRPGVFAFGGREVTLKQAVALAGGFAALAWPSRSEIVRREAGTDKQLTIPVNLDAVFAGREADVILRPDDILNVGTHVAAPFLFVLRNSFRFTYGFGFVYDRNFADKDAFFAQTNPASISQQNDLRRGLPF